MALVKKMGLAITPDPYDDKEIGWSAIHVDVLDDGVSMVGSDHNDLNRAICECVAKMQASNGGTK